METPDGQLLPFVSLVDEPQESDFAETNNDRTSGAGTTKRKELHGTSSIHGLFGTWANKPNDITLNAYKIKFVSNQVGKNYCGFVLLIETAIENEITDQEIDLYLQKNRVVKTSISFGGQVHLNASQLKKCKLFQELLFNGLFGKLFTGSKSNGSTRIFLLKDGLTWSSSNMYLLLPLVTSSSNSIDLVSINWKGIDACVSVVEILRNIYSADYRNCCECSFTCSSSYQTNCDRSDTIHMANRSVCINTLKYMVVLAVHTGKIYSVLDVICDKSAESSFDKTNGKGPKFVSFADYFHKKYNIELQHPKQPLVLVKQSYHPRNLLLSMAKCEDGSTAVERAYVHIPPELLVDLSISPEVLRSFYLLPSVMHRLTSMMLACQLREYVGSSHYGSQISSILILEAITTLRCCENFSLERLELLGDSVLKYAVSCHLFMKHPMKHEGQLSEHRSWAVCNSTLHNLGTSRSMQGYIRDSVFDPRRWVAPGQIPLHPLPCKCGIDTSEVPLERTYWTEDINIVIGKACDKGHRWMCSKTVADCVEALIGAYYIGGGLNVACSLMRWLGLDVTFEPLLVEEAKANASLYLCHPIAEDIGILESKFNYRFSAKGLLLEAITHPSQREEGIDYCYQRLEFLGDSVLDLLITSYLYEKHTDIDPGELTDLRSASVSNENFAQITVRNDLQHHLQHASEVLSGEIREYVNYKSTLFGNKASVLPLDISNGPKALGDLLESIAGAMLIDTNLDLDKVWGVFKPLLSPIVTPENLELPPLRELLELCGHLGYPINSTCTSEGEMVVAKLTVQLEDYLLMRSGCDAHRKAAKAQAALCLLKDLKDRGISHAQLVSKRKMDANNYGKPPCSNFEVKIPPPSDNDVIVPFCKQNVLVHSLRWEPSTGSSLERNCQLDNFLKNVEELKLNESVALPVKMAKGGPRSALFELCRRFRWPRPRFESTEEKFREPFLLNGVMALNKYTSSITLLIPNSPAFTLEGEPRADKKSSRDSASLAMLRALEKQGICIVNESR